MAYTPNPTWVDGTGGGTLITAAKLNNIENGLALAASVADAALPKAGGTVTGDVVVNNAKVSAGTTTDVLGTALEVKRNGVVTGRIDNNASGMRVQAQAGTLQLRGTGNTGVSVGSDGKASFDAEVKLASYTTATRPAASTSGAGALIYDTTVPGVFVSNGSAWVQL